MKQACYILAQMRSFILCEEFTNKFRLNQKDFVRKRILTIQVIFLFILNLPKKSIAIELLKFSSFLPKSISRAAITKARSKLSAEAFQGLNRIFVKEFYTDNNTHTFYGFTLLAIDGSLIELPLNSPQIEQRYGTTSNQTDCKKPMARSSTAFDVLNGITLDAILAPYKSAERDLAIQHIENLRSLNLPQSFLLLLDRGYPSLALIVYLLLHKVQFVMRCNTKFMKEVNKAAASRKKDVLIKFKAKRNDKSWNEIKQFFPSLSPKIYFSLRVLIVTLNTGEKEILLTSLLDKAKYPYKIFMGLYFKRWGIETEYSFKKEVLEIENFSGKSCVAVEQDFHAAVIVGNVLALLSNESQKEIERSSLQKYEYKTNKNVGTAILKDSLIEALITPEICLQGFCTDVKRLMRRHVIPIRPGRTRPRKRRHFTHKYHMSQR